VSGAPSSNPQGEPMGSNPASAGLILIPDAGVGVKWDVLEPDSGSAVRLLDPRFELHVPSFFFTGLPAFYSARLPSIARCQRLRAWPPSSSFRIFL
jgi:hypothetical protein